jgi:hypothetical protein
MATAYIDSHEKCYTYGIHLTEFDYGMTCLLWVGANQLGICDIRDVKAQPFSTSARKYDSVRNIP